MEGGVLCEACTVGCDCFYEGVLGGRGGRNHLSVRSIGGFLDGWPHVIFACSCCLRAMVMNFQAGLDCSCEWKYSVGVCGCGCWCYIF